MENTEPENTSKAHPEKEKVSSQLHTVFIIIQLITLVLATFTLTSRGNYGWTLFCVIPFSLGLTVGSYTRTSRSKKYMVNLGITFLAILFLSVSLLIAGVEGAICIVMALGLLLLPAFVGLVVGYLVRNFTRIQVLLIIFLLNTSSYVYDTNSDEQVSATATESIMVNAPKEKIWNVLTNPVCFSSHPNVFFKAGVSYPTQMNIRKDGNCLFLNCRYNNGETNMKILRLDSLKCMEFYVGDDITSMSELSFHKEVSAPHLKGYFKASTGRFDILEISPGRCLVTASTSYSYKITPEFYWHWWTDYLTNSMHRHVLSDIKRLSEL